MSKNLTAKKYLWYIDSIIRQNYSLIRAAHLVMDVEVIHELNFGRYAVQDKGGRCQ